MSLKNKIVDWRQLVEKWQKSGLNKTDFCRQNRIDISRFKYHSVKLNTYSRSRKNTDEAMVSDKNSFAEVVCSSSEPKSITVPGPVNGRKASLILRLDCGGGIESTADFDAEILKRVLKIARDL